MVELDVVRAENSRLTREQPIVAVFTGGTGGIGLTTLKTLAATHGSTGKGLRVYIVGRSKDATYKIVSDCLALCPQGDFRFVKTTDLSLLEEVDRVCQEIIEAEQSTAAHGDTPRIDVLCMSQGELSLEAHTETKEGLEWRVSLLYYSRMKTVVNLLPLLLKSSLPAHVISVFAAGMESQFYVDDLFMRQPAHQGIATTRSHVTYLTTFFFESLAAQHPGKLSLVHLYPGLILTDGFKNMPLWFRVIWRVFVPILGLFCTSIEECGERVLFLASRRFPAHSSPATAGNLTAAKGSTTEPQVGVASGTDLEPGSGAYGVTLDAETIPANKVHKSYDKYREEGLGEKLVAHTLKAFEDIKAGKRA